MLALVNGKVFIKGRLIKANLILSKRIEKITKEKPAVDNTIDCSGKIIIPGLIDPHVHFRDPGQTYKEDWTSGSKAAAHGGVTTVLDMPNNVPPITTPERLKEKIEIAKKKSIVNFGLYFGIGPNNLETLGEVKNIVCGYKMFMCKSTGDLLLTDVKKQEHAFETVSKTEKVLAVHAETPEINEAAMKNKIEDLPESYANTKPPESEIKAIEKALSMTKVHDTKLHVVHLTTAGGIELIKNAKMQGLDVTTETCPHYLFFTKTNMREKKAFLAMNPPLRTKKDQAALWSAISAGTIDMISTDHAPHTTEEKSQSVWSAPGGVPGVETRAGLMIDAVNKRLLSFERFVEICCENPAKRFDIKERGFIEAGFFADITVVDMKKHYTIKTDNLYTKCGWSPFEGFKLKGCPVMTISEGKIIMEDGVVL